MDRLHTGAAGEHMFRSYFILRDAEEQMPKRESIDLALFCGFWGRNDCFACLGSAIATSFLQKFHIS